jgi:hypothetical protein
MATRPAEAPQTRPRANRARLSRVRARLLPHGPAHMARDKKPQKANKKKYTDPKTGEFRHSDGDRRHRRGASAKGAIKHKRLMQELGGLPPEEPPAEELPGDANG